jgi:hypothetical protein
MNFRCAVCLRGLWEGIVLNTEVICSYFMNSLKRSGRIFEGNSGLRLFTCSKYWHVSVKLCWIKYCPDLSIYYYVFFFLQVARRIHPYVDSVTPCLSVHVFNQQCPLTNFDEIWYWRLALNIVGRISIWPIICSPKIIHFLYEIDIFLSIGTKYCWSNFILARICSSKIV